MAKGKILVTTRSFRNTEGEHQQILLDAGYEIVKSPYNRACTATELAELIVGMDAAILGVDDVSAPVFEAADKLKVASRYGVGIDRVDAEAATRHGVVVTNTPGGNTNSVAELTITLMLSLARNVPLHDRNSRNNEWGLVKGRELVGSTIGILGMGRIGQRVAEIAHAFGMRILFYDPYPPSQAFLERVTCELASVEHIISESDFVSLHLPLLPETQNLFNADTLSQMKATAYLVNTARGGLVDEVALHNALQNGVISGAAFDAFAEEPPENSPLVHLPNFITTPHIGSSTLQTTLRMGLMASQNVLAVLAGEPCDYVINPEAYRWVKG